MEAINIIWDIDNKDELSLLPFSLEIPRSLFYSDIETISDYISDKTGFCHKGFDIVRTERECLKLIEDAIRLNLLTYQDGKVLVYKEGLDNMVFVSMKEAVKDLYSDVEAQELFIEKINEVDKKKHISINGVVEIPSFLSEEEFTELFSAFIEKNYWSFGGGIKEE